MDNLRLILLIIGCILVLGIYLWEVFYKGTPKKRTDILDAVDEIPDIPIQPMSNGTDDYSTPLSDLGSLLTQSRNQSVNTTDSVDAFKMTEPIKKTDVSISNLKADDGGLNNIEPSEVNIKDDAPDKDLPMDMSVKDYESSLSDNNDYDIFAAIEEDIHTQEHTAIDDEVSSLEDVNKEVEIPQNNQTSDDLLVLYITSPSHILFNGLSISKAVDEVGMVYGHMNIFHHFGPGKLHSGQPLFSIANMYEPGSFDLGRMADLKTKGIAAFMYSPASIDASVVFELFLNTTQRIAELLGGEVRTSNNELLNTANINSLREKAELLSAK